MEITFNQAQQNGIVKLTGDLNVVQADSFRQKFKDWIQANPSIAHVIIDLADVPMIDSAGLGVLIGMMKIVHEKSGQFLLCNLQKRVRMVFEITRTQRIFDIFDNQEEAISSLK
jgi:anti-sigma B factor antagonist